MSFKIASSGLLIFFAAPGTELGGAVLNSNRCRSFHVAELPKTGKKFTKNETARAERAKLLFSLIKCAKFITFSLPSRRSNSLLYENG